MMGYLSMAAGGLLFGMGLWISGMSHPVKVLNFLDVTGTWDPSLLLVLGGASGVAMIAFRFVMKRPSALFGNAMQVPASEAIDTPLVAGALLFGIGWGIGGYCPGPALTALSTFGLDTIVFVIAMAGGHLMHRACAGS
jgi:uncharacterized protein